MMQTHEGTSHRRNRSMRARRAREAALLDNFESNDPVSTELMAERRANRLGWLSIGLGAAEIAAPRALARLIGIRAGDRTDGVLRLMGMREIAVGLGVLARARPTGFMWARVAGDALDIALLMSARARGAAGRQRQMFAALSLLGVTALDIASARKLAKVDRFHLGAHEEKKRLHLTHSITIRRPLEEVAARWAAFSAQEEPMAKEDVQFIPAPSGRGTEVHVRHGRLQGLRVDRALRHFKQILETGEVVRSDASIHRGMHPAQPPARFDMPKEELAGGRTDYAPNAARFEGGGQ